VFRDCALASSAQALLKDRDDAVSRQTGMSFPFALQGVCANLLKGHDPLVVHLGAK